MTSSDSLRDADAAFRELENEFGTNDAGAFTDWALAHREVVCKLIKGERIGFVFDDDGTWGEVHDRDRSCDIEPRCVPVWAFGGVDRTPASKKETT